ncbi:MAG: hypothetical protein ACFFD4_01875 [Candidatus Odinarchaeota archaeon]
MQGKRNGEPWLYLQEKLPGEDDYYQLERRELLAFSGSLIDETRKTGRMARLHKQITAQETGYQQKRRFLELEGVLVQWFNTSLLDRVFFMLEKGENRQEPSVEEEITKIIAYLDVLLRLEGNTVRWKTLTEMSDYFGFRITRKGLFRYRVEAQRVLFEQYGRRKVLEKLRTAPELLMKRLISEYIANDTEMVGKQKNLVKVGCLQVITAIKDLRYVPRDYEIYAYAVYVLVKKGLTGKAGEYTFPVDDPKFRRAVANATYNVKKRVLEKIWNSLPCVSFPGKETREPIVKTSPSRVH